MNTNKQGKIIIIEGVWGAGKSTFIKKVAKKIKAKCVPEPNHIKSKILSKNADFLTKWYFKAHKKNLKKAEFAARAGKIVFIERCPLSSIVFSKVRLNKNAGAEMLSFEYYLKNLRKQNIIACLAYLKPKKIEAAAKIMKRKYYLKSYAEINFLESLDRQLRIAIQKLKKAGLIKLYKNPTPKSLAVIIHK